ncbi:glycerophosphodiester phosphodiesterase family protein [Desulfatiferula olefinivorans]
MTSPSSQPLIIAHRGYRARYPENTLAAFRAALNIPTAMIELDVCLSRDRQLVVIHDETLDRTTSGHGPVAGFTLAELKTLDAGRWFSPVFTGEPIPTLTEVLDLCRNRCALNIEIKPEAFEAHHPSDAVERQVIESVTGRFDPRSVIISSFEPRVIEQIARMAVPGLRTALLTEHRPLDDALLDFMVRNNVFSWNPDHPVLTPDQIARAHRNGLKVLTYTVNHGPTGRALLAMGADGLFTDEPLLF